jgi:ligand-binding SRPBCC domain-containing protein
MSDILLKGQQVYPNNLIEAGFKFKFSTLKAALDDILKFSNKGETVLKKYLWVNKPVNSVFDFFSNENNLEKITPPYLKFKVVGKNTENIEQGTLINYKLKVHGLPFKWKSNISSFVVDKTFTDEQVTGPYSKWVHRHDFITHKQGTLMVDEVVYKLPMGFFGKICAGYFVNKDVQNIFKYRSEVIQKVFA